MSFFVKKLFSADDASFSIVCSLGFKPRGVSSSEIPLKALNHYDANFNLIVTVIK